MVEVGWISLPNTGEPAHRLQTSPTVPLRYPGRGFLDLAVGGNPSVRDIWALGEPGSNSPCHVVWSFCRGAQKRLISFGQAPGSHLPPGSLPAPATS